MKYWLNDKNRLILLINSVLLYYLLVKGEIVCMATFEEKVNVLRLFKKVNVATMDSYVSTLEPHYASFIADALADVSISDLLAKYKVNRHTLNRWLIKFIAGLGITDSMTAQLLANKNTTDNALSVEDSVIANDRLSDELSSDGSASKLIDVESDTETAKTTKSPKSSKSSKRSSSSKSAKSCSDLTSENSIFDKNALCECIIKAILLYDEAKHVSLFFSKTLKYLYKSEPGMWKLLLDDLSVRKDDKARAYKLAMKMAELRMANPDNDSDYFVLFLRDINEELKLDTYANNYLRDLSRSN